jgi:signal peptidase II
VLLNIGCDQITKDIVRNKVEPNAYIQVISNHLILTNVENTGAMMGFGRDLPPVIKLVLLQLLPSLVLLLLLGRILQKTNLNRWLVLSFALVIGGGIGNLIDRIAYGSVTDFFQLKLGFLRTGIFNMADVSVTVGVFVMLLITLKLRKMEI